MRKLFLLVQWLVVVLAIYWLWSNFSREYPDPDYQPKTWAQWEGLHVLSYVGLSDDDDGETVAPALFREQLEALKAAGYQTVTLTDVASFYKLQRPLPENALVLLMEGGRKDHVVRGTEVLQELGYFAHLGLPTSLSYTWGSYFVRPRDVHRMTRIPNWGFYSMGNRAVEVIPAKNNGEGGNYLSHRFTGPNGPESDEEFTERIEEDLTMASQLIKSWTGLSPLAIQFPYGDNGGGGKGDPIAESVIREVSQDLHAIAFLTEGSSWNSARQSPYHLNYLRVGADWSGEQLVSMLEKGQPSGHGLKPDSDYVVGVNRRLQTVAKGETLEVKEKELCVFPDTSGLQDLDVQMQVQRQEGTEMNLYLRNQNRENRIRIHLADEVLLAQEEVNGTVHNLAYHSLPNQKAVNDLRVKLKNNRMWVMLNGKDLTGPLVLNGVSGTGDVRLELLKGSASIHSLSAVPLPPKYLYCESLREITEIDPNPYLGIFLPLDPEQPEKFVEGFSEFVQWINAGTLVIPVVSAPAEGQEEAWLENLRRASENNPMLRGLIYRIGLRGGNPEMLRKLTENGLKGVFVGSLIASLELPEDLPDAWWVFPGGIPEGKGDELRNRIPSRQLMVPPETAAEWEDEVVGRLEVRR